MKSSDVLRNQDVRTALRGFCRIEKSIAYGSLSRESERRGGRSTSRSYLIDAREANRIKKEGFASIYKVASQHLSTTPSAPAKELRGILLMAQPPLLI